MNYKKIYDQLVEKCRVRGLDKSALEGYYEKHHIVPRCLGGGNGVSNLVMFTAREHYVAHLLLARLHPEKVGLTYAAFMMGSDGRNSKLYSNMRTLVSVTNSRNNTGRLKTDYTGKKIGRLTVQKYMVDYKINGRRKPKWECLCECGNTTYIATQYLSDGRIISCGCLLSETSRGKMLGKEKSLEVRTKISETIKAKQTKPWMNVKLKDDDRLKWLSAVDIFNFWTDNKSPKAQNMTLLYNAEHSTSHKRSYFKTIIKCFIDGWVPQEDEDWNTWRSNNASTGTRK